jgi:hypothetical protein
MTASLEPLTSKQWLVTIVHYFGTDGFSIGVSGTQPNAATFWGVGLRHNNR